MKRMSFALLALALAGCADHARIYPMDSMALRTGTPKFEFVRNGLDNGPVTITMPNGEVLRGEYQVTQNAAAALAITGRHLTTAVGVGGDSPVVINAVGNRGTIMNCEGTADLDGNGSAVCDGGPKVGKFRIMF